LSLQTANQGVCQWRYRDNRASGQRGTRFQGGEGSERDLFAEAFAVTPSGARNRGQPFSLYARRQHERPLTTAQMPVRPGWSLRGGCFASAPSAQSKHLFHSGRRMILIRPSSIVTDAADGADGVMASAITYRRYPDCPRSQPPLAAEDNLNTQGAQEGLCPPQPPSECARTLGPAGPLGADCKDRMRFPSTALCPA
jgi:hypothetical protein